MKKMICIVCPVGCHLSVTKKEIGYLVEGNQCPRGKTYALQEMENPTRVVTTTVALEGAKEKRLPVKTDKPVPKEQVFDFLEQRKKVKTNPPIFCGQKIMENILGTGISYVATRDMED